MLKPWQFKLLTGLGVVAVLLIVANGILFTNNRAVQIEANNRQQYIQQSATLEGLYRDIVRALAELAVKNNDTQLRQMLSAQGINITVNQPAPEAVAAPAPAPAPAKKR